LFGAHHLDANERHATYYPATHAHAQVGMRTLVRLPILAVSNTDL